MKRFEVELRGSTAYLMDRFPEDALENNVRKRSGGQMQADANYDSKFYRTSNGKPYVPSNQVLGCLVNAGKELRVVGRGKKNYSTIFASTVDIRPEEVPIKSETPYPYKISGVNPTTKTRVMIVRPRFEKWSLKFEMQCEDDQVPGEVIEEGLHIGGKSVGIGAWRPNKRGRFGKFEVIKFKELKNGK